MLDPGQTQLPCMAASALFPDEPGSQIQGTSRDRCILHAVGDVLQAGIVYAGTALGFVLSSFAALNMAFTVVWFFIATALAIEYKKRSSKPVPKEMFDETELRPSVSHH